MSLRVTLLVNRINLSTGGGSHHSLSLTLTALHRLGVDVRVVVLEGLASPPTADVPYPIVVEDGWKRSTRFGRLRAVADILRRHEHETDVFHVYSAGWGPAAGLYRATGAVPTIVTLNNFALWCTNPDLMDGRCHQTCSPLQRALHSPTSPARRLASIPLRSWEHMVASPWVRRVDHFLPDSPATKRVHEEAGFDLTRSTLVPEVIDFKALRAAAEQPLTDLGLATDVKHLLYAGRLTKSKGADLLLDALQLIKEPVHLHVAGEGPNRPTLERRAQQLGVSERVTFHGWVANRQLWNLLRSVDLFIHPGRWPEPCGRSVQEALALGVPTLVSNIGGPPWLVGEYGRTFVPGDAADLAAKVDQICTDYDAASASAVRGIGRAAEFDYHTWVPKIAEIYRDVAASRLVTKSA